MATKNLPRRVHLAGHPDDLARKGIFETAITRCAVALGQHRLASNDKHVATCLVCLGKRKPREPVAVRRSVVRDKPGHPVAAPCAISHCLYFELAASAGVVDAAVAALQAGPVIRVWRFADAPPSYRELSPHGGDEDWLVLVPPALADTYLGWADTPVFGHPSYHPLDDGSLVIIAAHA